jgi:hypothetical protein
VSEQADPAEPVGTLAEEAARLFAALAGAARQHGAGVGDGLTGLGDRAAAAIHQVDEHMATGADACRYCPVCRAVDLVRGTNPDVAEHLADAAQSLSRAVAAMLATATVDNRRPASPGPGGPGSVEHIDLNGVVEVDDAHDQHPQHHHEEDA